MTRDQALMLEVIHARLDAITDPCSIAMGKPMSLLEMGLVENVAIAADGAVTITLCLTDTACVHFGGMRDYIEQSLRNIAGICSVRVDHTTEVIWTDERILSRTMPRTKLPSAR
ncbi:iron-sulfur cluster assembly protein [Tsuneonella sp. CC-YZS046]|uniref:iron-sulfur cluster assembly protein n=1 Tax=Tsuneonella sp. CC-YZS046 TaxID=3042152 RepID=UPI002D769848|nr:iron-sulfur cluster assembly protein [Tsuneonella sp. CC-YZS046]WRO66694.1 iron-sulfur cluster assembly protein [Tsuneonella sp. CC-YZS046]